MVQKKEIKNYPGYWIYSDGRVWSDKSQKFLSYFENNQGYYIVSLYQNGKDIKLRIHRLVAEAFIPNPNNLPQINHKDENKHNNNVNNLEWINHQNNQNYGTRNQRMADAHKKSIVMLNKETLEEIKIFDSLKEAAIFLNKPNGMPNISRALTGQIKTAYGYCWKYNIKNT